MLRNWRGGVSTFLALAHVLDATQLMGWDVNVPCTCTHVGCYAIDGVGWDVNVPCTCTHVEWYTIDGVGCLRSLHLHACWMLRNWWGGMLTFLALAHMLDATQNGNTKCSETQVLNKKQSKITHFSRPPTIWWLHEVLRLPVKNSQEILPIVNSVILELDGLPNKHANLGISSCKRSCYRHARFPTRRVVYDPPPIVAMVDLHDLLILKLQVTAT